MDLTNLKKINDTNADKTMSIERHRDLIDANTKVSNTVLSATASLIRYLEGHTTKTQVVNQLRTINTPDALRVIPAIKELHETIKTHENVDLSEITTVMRGILDEAKKLPKELPEQKFTDYSDQMKNLENAIKTVETAIKEQKMNVEAPIIHIPKPQKITIPKPEVKIVKETTEVTNEITVQDWRKEYVFSDSSKTDKVNYYGYLKTDGSWYIMRHRQDDDEDGFSEGWDEIRYVFGEKNYPKAFNKREGQDYKYLNEARDE